MVILLSDVGLNQKITHSKIKSAEHCLQGSAEGNVVDKIN